MGISVAIGDVTNDGQNDIIALSQYRVYCINGSSHQLIWDYLSSVEIYFQDYPPVLADIDNDSGLEILYGATNNGIFCLEGETGTQKWNTTGMGAFRGIAVGDIEMNGDMEVICGMSGGLFCLNGENGVQKWNFTNGYQFFHPRLADFDNNGYLEVVIQINDGNGRLLFFNCQTQSVEWSVPSIYYPDNRPVIVDVDGDKELEIIFGSRNNSYMYPEVGCLSRSGEFEWIARPQSQAWIFEVAIGDVDQDQQLEVIATYEYDGDPYLAVLSGASGAIETDIAVGQYYRQNAYIPALADTNNDSILDIVITKGYSGYGDFDLITYSYSKETGSYSAHKTNYNIMSYNGNPCLGDIDQDGAIELVYPAYNNLYIYEEVGYSWSQASPWPCLGGSSYHQGCYLDSDGDTLPDQLEQSLGLDDQDNDTDHDLLPDDWECLYGINPLVNTSLGDLDADGVPNYLEYYYHTLPRLNDSDADDLDDGYEIGAGLDPLSSDTDQDTMPDGYEVTNGFDPLNISDGQLDFDGDLLVNADEFSYRSDPTNPDTDGDTMTDGYEATCGLLVLIIDADSDKDGDLLTNLEEFNLGTLANKIDTDGDSLSDYYEVNNSLDPLDPEDIYDDPDHDGLNNIGEFGNGTDVNNPDTDTDGIYDGWEVLYGFDPLAGEDAVIDSDCDNLNSLEEFLAGTNPYSVDTDNDNLLDAYELRIGTDPTDDDSDNDTYLDGTEVQFGSDPLDPSSIPTQTNETSTSTTSEFTTSSDSLETSTDTQTQSTTRSTSYPQFMAFLGVLAISVYYMRKSRR